MKKGLLVFLISMFLCVSPVFACVGGPAGTNCADDIVTTTSMSENDGATFYADGNAIYNDSSNGSLFLAGNTVDFSGIADGIAFVAGNSVSTKGQAEYAMYAGNTVDVLGTINKDAFVAGNIININGNISRDIFVVGTNVTLSGTIGRNVTIFASNIILDNVSISGNAKIYGESIIIKDDTNIVGKLTYGAEMSNISTNATIGSQVKEEFDTVKVTYVDVIKAKVLSYVSMLLVFVVFALLIPASIKKVGEDKLSFLQIVTYIGYALVFLILVPIASIFLMVIEIGFPLALMALGLYIAAIYLSYMYMGYYIGKKIWLAKNSEENVLLEGLIGISIVYAVTLIPTVGNIFGIIAFLCGLGILIFNFKK